MFALPARPAWTTLSPGATLNVSGTVRRCSRSTCCRVNDRDRAADILDGFGVAVALTVTSTSGSSSASGSAFLSFAPSGLIKQGCQTRRCQEQRPSWTVEQATAKKERRALLSRG